MSAQESALEALAIVNKALKDALVTNQPQMRDLMEHCIAKDLELDFESAAETRALPKRFDLLKEKPKLVVEILKYDPMRSSNDGIHEGQNPNHMLFDGTALQIFRKLVLRVCHIIEDQRPIRAHTESVSSLLDVCDQRGIDESNVVYQDAKRTVEHADDMITQGCRARLESISKALHNRAFTNAGLYGQRNRCLTEFLLHEPLHQNQKVAWLGNADDPRAFRVYYTANSFFELALAAHKTHATNWSRRDMATAMEVLKRNGVWQHVTALGKRKFVDLDIDGAELDWDDAE